MSLKSLKDSNEINGDSDLNWMYQIDLANNSRQQNLEIIYNNKNVYYKTIKPVHRDDLLVAFPSKDLEISLGLQYIAITSGTHFYI